MKIEIKSMHFDNALNETTTVIHDNVYDALCRCLVDCVKYDSMNIANLYIEDEVAIQVEVEGNPTDISKIDLRFHKIKLPHHLNTLSILSIIHETYSQLINSPFGNGTETNQLNKLFLQTAFNKSLDESATQSGKVAVLNILSEALDRIDKEQLRLSEIYDLVPDIGLLDKHDDSANKWSIQFNKGYVRGLEDLLIAVKGNMGDLDVINVTDLNTIINGLISECDQS